MKVNELTNESNIHLISDSSRYEVKITCDSDEINQAKKLRLIGHSKQTHKESNLTSKNDVSVTKKLIEHHKLLIHDGYDSYAQHLIVKDLKLSRVVAYARIIDAFTAFKIGGFYSETQFNIKSVLQNQQYLMEISRVAIHYDYNSEHVADLLWSGINLFASENGFDAIIGCLSIPLSDHFNGMSQLISHYKTKYMSPGKLRVTPYQMLPDNRPFNITSINAAPYINFPQLAYINFMFSKGVALCGGGHWNKTLNTAELFIHYKVTNIQHVPQCIQESEVELGLLCI